MNRHEIENIMSMYDGIVMMRSVEYFSKNNWMKLPESWRELMRDCSMEDIISIVNDNDESGVRMVLPLSIICLKSISRKQCYSRAEVRSPAQLRSQWRKEGRSKEQYDNSFKSISSDGVLRKNIKFKKQHEIDRIVELVRQITDNLDDIDSLVDIGAGVGHLSRIIAIHNNIQVMAVEGNEQFTVAANCLDQQIISKGPNLNFGTSPVRFTSFVTEELSLKIDNFSKNHAILVGLHTCGDFSSTILNVFKNSEKAKALILFGCCYHKEYQCFHFYNVAGDSVEEPRISGVFPLSDKWKGFELGYIAREMACHSNENLEESSKKPQNISRYARAHLEKWVCLTSDREEDWNIGMSPVKCEAGKTTFEEYIMKAMNKRGSHLVDRVIEKIRTAEPNLLTTPVSDLPRHYFDVADTIRLMFAPLIESCIIDDRLEYLRENGYIANAVPLFDPKISPRNIAIVAYKS